MLQRLGFCDRWICWIKGCLESVSVSVLVNGSPTKEFIPLKGVHQGDPLVILPKTYYVLKSNGKRSW